MEKNINPEIAQSLLKMQFGEFFSVEGFPHVNGLTFIRKYFPLNHERFQPEIKCESFFKVYFCPFLRNLLPSVVRFLNILFAHELTVERRARSPSLKFVG